MWQPSNTIPGHMHHIALCCLEDSTMSNLVHRRRRCARIVSYMILLPGRQYAKDGFFFYHGLNGLNEVVLWRKEEIKKLVAFPGLTPLQPDVYAQPSKRASLSDIPIRLVCPLADRKAPKQNSCPWQYKMSLQRRLLTVTSDLPGAYPMAYCPPGRGLVVEF